MSNLVSKGFGRFECLSFIRKLDKLKASQRLAMPGMVEAKSCNERLSRGLSSISSGHQCQTQAVWPDWGMLPSTQRPTLLSIMSHLFAGRPCWNHAILSCHYALAFGMHRLSAQNL